MRANEMVGRRQSSSSSSSASGRGLNGTSGVRRIVEARGGGVHLHMYLSGNICYVLVSGFCTLYSICKLIQHYLVILVIQQHITNSVATNIVAAVML